ncbi:MAG: ABC transporter permease subunit [Rhizobiales bacterium]|nr:ABC transporter permease subunit [Hyphomicrobiales bacterium]
MEGWSYYWENRGSRLLLTAYVVAFFIFLIAPILIVVVVSFSATSYVAFPPREGLSLQWFQRFWEYKPFLNSLIVSIQIALLSAALGALLGVPAALALVRSRRRLANTVMTFLLSPLSMPLIVLGFALLFFLSRIGFGVSFLSLLIAHTVVSLPYIVRTVAGVYRGISPEFEETAAILGANRWQVFVNVTLPMIKPGIFAGALFAMLISLDNLPISYFFGSAETNTLPVVMLSYLEHQFDPSVAAASTIQLLVAIVGLVILERTYGLQRIGMPT